MGLNRERLIAIGGLQREEVGVGMKTGDYEEA